MYTHTRVRAHTHAHIRKCNAERALNYEFLCYHRNELSSIYMLKKIHYVGHK